jgi:hypothetical protein
MTDLDSESFSGVGNIVRLGVALRRTLLEDTQRL